jgi:hypothetical protein
MELLHEHRDDEPMAISCGDCCHRDTDACSDCVVTFLCERDPEDAVVIDVEEARGLRLLQQVGLVPGIRYRGTA